MTKVVVKLEGEAAGDGVRLAIALDAFAKWCEETIDCADSSQALDFMMTTEHTGAEVRRKITFHDRSHAAKFLTFWRRQRVIPDKVAS